MRYTLSLLIYLLITSTVVGQSKIAINSLGGFVIAHRPIMQQLITGHATGAEITWEKTLAGTKSWHQSYVFPVVGVSALWLDLGNPKQLGSSIALTPYFRLPLNPAKNLSIKLGLGLGYNSQRYQRVENAKNIAIGSHFNASIAIGFWYKAQLSNRIAIQSGIQLQHFSNGAFRAPNLGINIPMVCLGLQFGSKTNPLPTADLLPNPNTTQTAVWYFSPRFGLKELMSTGKALFPTYNLHFSRQKTMSTKFCYTLFADLLYNSSLEEESAEKGIFHAKKIQYLQSGLGAGLENTYGNFSIYVQMAAYLYSKQAEVGRFYHRLGVKHQLGNKQYLSFGLKSHFAKADYLELGWGIKLR